MSQKPKHNLILIINIALIAAWSIFIWHNSAQPAAISAGRSLHITDIINNILAPANIIVTDHFIRKTAHFVEYGINGFLWSILALQTKKPTKMKNYYFILIGFIIAFIDETIQRYTPGRSCEFKDMILDTAGFFCGFIIPNFIQKMIIVLRHHPS